MGMRVLTTIMFAVAATSSVAAAQSYTPDPYAHERIPYTGPHERWRHPLGWVQLGTPTPTRFGTETFMLGHTAGWYHTLRFEHVSGIVVLRQVRLVSNHHFVQTINVNIRLDRWHDTTFINLGRPRYVDEIVVTTDRWPRGTYAIYGTGAPQRPMVSAR